MKFPYKVHRIPIGGKRFLEIYRPEIAIKVVGSITNQPMWALVDTGADFTVLPRRVADVIGIQLDANASRKISGVTGHSVPIEMGRVTLSITDGRESYEWHVEVGFVALSLSMDEGAILGHEGFLDFFTATFDGKKHELALKPNSQLPKG